MTALRANARVSWAASVGAHRGTLASLGLGGFMADEPTASAGEAGAFMKATQEEIANFPPAVYVPTVEGDDGQMRLNLQVTRDGRKALLVYSALDRLQRWFGTTQWALISSEKLQSLYDESPFDLLFLDKSIVPESEEANS